MPIVWGGFFMVKRYRFKEVFLPKKKSYCQEFYSSLLSCPNVMGQKKIIPL